MTPHDRDTLLLSIRTDLDVIKSHVIGLNGTPGLVRRVGALEEKAARLSGGFFLVGLALPIATALAVKLIF